MKKIILILFLPLIIFCQNKTGVIKGRIIDAENGSPIAGASVFLFNTKLGASADINGYYKITNVPLGKYITQCTFPSYPSQKDTLELTPLKNEIENNIYMSLIRIPISLPDSLIDYHKLFTSIEPADILTITIDSMSIDCKYLFITFSNKTKFPIFLIEDGDCFSTISVLMKNDKGEELKRNIIDLGCDVIGVNYLPQKNNLIELKPFGSVKLSPVEIKEYAILNYPALTGKYDISVIYEIKEYKYLPGIFTIRDVDYYSLYKDEIEVLQRATKGKYYSVNTISIEK